MRIDLLQFHGLGNVEYTPCEPPKGLEFQSLLSDPQLEVIGFFQMQMYLDAGVFVQVKCGQRIFFFHSETVRKMYRVDNFTLKRNYFVSTTEQDKVSSKSSETEQEYITYQREVDRLNSSGIKLPGSLSSSREDYKKSNVSWADMNEEGDEDDILSLDTSISSTPGEAGKHSNRIYFLEESFIDQLSSMGQRRIPVADYFQAHPAFKTKDFYLFDYVALFVDFNDIFENRGDFKIPLVETKFHVCNTLEGTDNSYTPLQATNNKGWSPSVRFLCQTLNGENQISFLRVVLAYAIYKVTNRKRIAGSPSLKPETKSFLLGDKSFQNDCLKVIRLNLHALANNQKILLDQNYADTYCSAISIV